MLSKTLLLSIVANPSEVECIEKCKPQAAWLLPSARHIVVPENTRRHEAVSGKHVPGILSAKAALPSEATERGMGRNGGRHR